MNLIILGPQGSGKGTQAELLADELKLFYFESGRFLREVAKRNPKIGKIVNQKGKLLPDELVFSLMSRYLNEKVPRRDNILFDGYPRSVKQHELLKDWLVEEGTKLDYAIFLEISEKGSVKRLSGRRICEKCGTIYNLITNPPPGDGCLCGGKLIKRPDDRPEVIKARLTDYRKTTLPLTHTLEKEGILMKFDGERPIEVIFKDILGRLGVKNARK